ncbi:MAG: esterase-like activity of phytase family protein [Pseudomonadota bacterium]
MKTTLLATSMLAIAATGALAQDISFNRVSSFGTYLNNGEAAGQESSAEIISATPDGMMLVYSDSPLQVVGMIDISDPADPQPAGTIALEGEPTAVSVLGGTVFVGINTSESYTAPSGQLAHYVLETGERAAACDLGGQPDSTAVAPDGSFVAVAIENERDEDLGDGRVGQAPGGFVAIVPLDGDGMMRCDAMILADVSGLADIAPEDPEPEFVDVSPAGQIAVTLQENNHIVVLTSDGALVSHFSAGTVTLDGVDTNEEGALRFTDTLVDVPREPDAIQWIDNDHFAIANEVDMDGGSRGFTVFRKDGTELFESGLSFEYAVAQIGHYPEDRSGNKGVEPEGMEFAVFDGTPMLFLLSERGSVVGVYDMTDPAAPVLTQLLPSGIAPEGAVAIPARNLVAIANEADLIEDNGARSHVMIFEQSAGAPAYPMLTSEGLQEEGRPVGWGANSGMVAGAGSTVYFVNDSFYGMQPSIFEVDVAQTPARITGVTRITREGAPAQLMDLEGITDDGAGNFYVVSEGRTDRGIPHAIYHVEAGGEIAQVIPFPKEVMAVERRWAAEGITRVGGTLYVVMQREFDDDPQNHVKVLAYDLEAEDWGVVHYPKGEPDTGWIGLSEIVARGGFVYFIERDNQIAERAKVKKITRVAVSDLAPVPLGSDVVPVLAPEEVRDLIPDLRRLKGYVQDKVEGLAILEDGTAWVSTDNDGVDDHSGETLFFSIGRLD